MGLFFKELTSVDLTAGGDWRANNGHGYTLLPFDSLTALALYLSGARLRSLNYQVNENVAAVLGAWLPDSNRKNKHRDPAGNGNGGGVTSKVKHTTQKNICRLQGWSRSRSEGTQAAWPLITCANRQTKIAADPCPRLETDPRWKLGIHVGWLAWEVLSQTRC